MQHLSRRGILVGALALTSCQDAAPVAPPQAAGPKLSADRIGYVVVQAPLVAKVRDLFKADVDKLVALNPAEIHVLLNSPGGIVLVAEDMIAYLNRLQTDRGITVVTHNVGLVGSAACYVFLAGQRRLTIPRGVFLFHELSLSPAGSITNSQLHEASAIADQMEARFLKMLTAKSRLSEAEAKSFIRRTVVLNAQEAVRDGIVDAVADVPRDSPAVVIQAAPPIIQRKPPQPAQSPTQ